MDRQIRIPRIIVLGGGLGGTIATYEIAEKVRERASVMLVSDRDRFSFTPSNPWVAVGWREPEAIQVEQDDRKTGAPRGREMPLQEHADVAAVGERSQLIRESQQLGTLAIRVQRFTQPAHRQANPDVHGNHGEE